MGTTTPLLRSHGQADAVVLQQQQGYLRLAAVPEEGDLIVDDLNNVRLVQAPEDLLPRPVRAVQQGRGEVGVEGDELALLPAGKQPTYPIVLEKLRFMESCIEDLHEVVRRLVSSRDCFLIRSHSLCRISYFRR